MIQLVDHTEMLLTKNFWDVIEKHKILPIIKCRKCKKSLGVTHSRDFNNLCIIGRECTRIVLGIHPDVHNAKGDEIPFTCWQKMLYLCPDCGGNAILGQLAEVVDKIKANILSRPVLIDEPNYIKEKGCWITATQFKQNGKGWFINAQVGLEELTPAHNMLFPKV
jgi:hypothetical protein